MSSCSERLVVFLILTLAGVFCKESNRRLKFNSSATLRDANSFSTSITRLGDTSIVINNTTAAHYSKWSSWSRCQDCFQLRSRNCIHHSCRSSKMYEERPCDKKRCRRKARQKDTFHLVHFDEESRLATKEGNSKVWSRWSEWSPCSEDCRTHRRRVCRKPGRCRKKQQTHSAYCYHEKTRCEHYILNLLDANGRATNHDRSTRYHYNNEQVHDDWTHIRWAQKKCGRPYKKTKMLKIIGGVEAKKYKWPWHVAVINIYMEVFCAGTLIAPRWILTAGHCIRNYLRVRLNEHDLRAKDGREIEMVIHKMFLHPKFDHRTVDNDIALLRLPRPVKLPVACLPTKPPVPKELCNIMGWGKVRSSDVYGTRILREAKIPVVTTDRCRKSYRQFLLTSNMFCAGWADGTADTCAGDSGGGLICKVDRSKKEAFTIQGITSFGDGCGVRNKYGIYTTVYNYKNWISYIMESYS